MNLIYSFTQKRIVSIFAIVCTMLAGSLTAQTNYAISMDGSSSSYASLGTVNPSGNFSTGLTIECWVKWGAFNSWSRLMEMGNGSASDNLIFANESTSNALRYEVYKGASTQGISGPANLVTGRWYHVAVTQDASGNTTLYVDGVSVASGSVQLPNNVSRTNCYIGKSNWASDGYLNGTVDEMRIWNIARTQQQLKTYMFKSVDPSSSGLIAYYHCDENGGSSFTNSVSGAGAGNGTVAASLTWTASPIQFEANALNFDGTDDYVAIGSPLASGSSYTKEAWVYFTGTYSAAYNILSSQGSPFWITLGKLMAGNNGPSPNVQDPTDFPTNTWVHVAISFDASTSEFKLYRDGTLIQSIIAGGFPYTAENNYIGTYFNGSSFASPFQGAIDEVRIWNVVRSQTDLQTFMNKEINPNSTDATGLVAYYTFNQNIANGSNSGVTTIIDQKGSNNGTLTNLALSGTSSNFVAQTGSLQVLPVQLLSFTASWKSNGIQLSWKTASEQNSLDFTLERSADGSSWTSLARLPAAGNSSSPNQYAYMDASPLTGNIFYRLLQRDADGRISYSPVIKMVSATDNRSFSLQSNSISHGQLQLTANEPVLLQLFSLDGKLLWSKNLSIGYQSLSLPIPSKGIYILRGGNSMEKLLAN
jgi:hypothetical protein